MAAPIRIQEHVSGIRLCTFIGPKSMFEEVRLPATIHPLQAIFRHGLELAYRLTYRQPRTQCEQNMNMIGHDHGAAQGNIAIRRQFDQSLPNPTGDAPGDQPLRRTHGGASDEVTRAG
jgi:hypothetical protein